MTTRILVLMAGLLLTIGLVSPAEAAAHHSRPSVPRQVVAATDGQDAGSALVSWRAPKRPGSAAVEAYAVTYAKASRPQQAVWVVVAAARRSAVIDGLEAGQRYVVRVAAYNRWGRGPWARTDLTVAARQEALYAVDARARTLVRAPTTGGRAGTVVLSGVNAATDLEVDGAGNVYVAASGTVTEVPVSGAPRVLGAASQVETDRAGNVYLGGDSGVVEIAKGGTRTVVSKDAVDTLGVDGGGTVTVGTTGYGATLTTYAPGAKPVRRKLADISLGGQILVDGRGNVYDRANSGGGAGFGYWVRYAPGSTTGVATSTRQAEYGATVAADDSFYLAQSGSFCPDISENTGACTPDRRVVSVARFAPDGHLLSDVATSGFSTRRYLGLQVAVDRTGALFAANRGSTGAAGLVRVPPTGGAAQRVLDGDFDLVAVG